MVKIESKHIVIGVGSLILVVTFILLLYFFVIKKCKKGSGCEEKECGPDKCGNPNMCGKCEKGTKCESGKCVACKADCKGKVCGDDGCNGSCGSCKEGETCVNGVCKCGTFSSCTGDNRCVKGKEGELKCCPPACKDIPPQKTGYDECSGEKCYCPITFYPYRDRCVCGSKKLTCETGDVCASDECKKNFGITTEHGPLTNIIRDMGNGVAGILINSKGDKTLADGIFTVPYRKGLQVYGKNSKLYNVYVDYEGKQDQISTRKGSSIVLSKNNALLYKKPGHGARFYLGIYKTRDNLYYAIPGKEYQGFKIV
jgi:hypothetical protein